MKLRLVLLAGILCAGILTIAGYAGAVAEPAIRTASLSLSEQPTDASSTKIVFLSDIHAAEPGASHDRIADIVQLVNEQQPDLVLIGGDFVSTKQIAWSHPDFTAAVAPLANLEAPLGVYAVLGNHDHWRDAEEGKNALEAIGITVLDNEAIQVGPFALGGVDDAHTHHANVSGTIAAMERIEGAKVLLSHSPDIMPEADGASLVLAGHTHCGQIALPLIGPIVTMSRFGKRYACGKIEEDGRTLIVGAGTGTSLLPIRFGAPPDIWIIEVKSQ